MTSGYTLLDASRLLGLPRRRVRSLVQAGMLTLERGAGGEERLRFEELAFLKTLVRFEGLTHEQGRRKGHLHRALRRLRARMPSEKVLASTALSLRDGTLVVREGDVELDAATGQGFLDFGDKAAPAGAVIALLRTDRSQAMQQACAEADEYERACALEGVAPDDAMRTYERLLTVDPTHVDSRINLGRLLHERGIANADDTDIRAALDHYRAALEHRPGDPIALFNLGVALDDLGHGPEAIRAYEKVVLADPTCADAYYNLARLYETDGDPQGALRNLRRYRDLTPGRV